MATHSTQKRVADSPSIIPDRLYFKIGDVAEISGLETYVLRFWESQFPQLKPTKSGTGQRLYRRREVELVLEIKRLVHSEGYTLAGARQALEGVRRRDQSRLPIA
ncbi:MAG: MerR family transcriptional regulator, partial [Terracidiphilus sp.]